jgi:hypothetical protein
MAIVRQLELDLWAMLQEAPESVEFPVIWQALDGALDGMGVVAQLQTAGRAIAQVAEIFQVQAGLVFEELEATAAKDGPKMGADAFDRYVRQSMAIDLEQYVEEPEGLPRQGRWSTTDWRSSVEAADFYSEGESAEKTVLLEVLHEEMVRWSSTDRRSSDAVMQEEALSVAHGEDISTWVEMIRVVLLELPEGVMLEPLCGMVGLQFIELWLGLLGDGLSRVVSQDEDEFYSAIGILVEL